MCVLCACVCLSLCVVLRVCVARLGTRKKPSVQHASVCTFKTPRVYWQHVRTFKQMWACCWYTRRRLEYTHEGVLNLRTGSEIERRRSKTKSHHVHQRFTASNQWILPMKSLRVGPQQQLLNSFHHAHYLLKLFSYSYHQGNSGGNKFSDGSFSPSHLCRCILNDYIYIYVSCHSSELGQNR